MIPAETVLSLADRGLVNHGFFGRQGGVSSGEFASLNVSTSTGDEPDAVAENRRLVAEALGGKPLFCVKQIHSATVFTLASGAVPETTPEADAIVTGRTDLLLGILTADCAPLLFLEPEAGIVGAAHAGWRGAVNGILINTIQAMEQLGARREHIRIALGPTISAKNYEVGQEFKDQALNLNPKAEFAFSKPSGGKPHFDLPRFLRAEAEALGVADFHDTALCTYAEPGRFFSHRYATHKGTRTGRQIAVIGLA